MYPSEMAKAALEYPNSNKVESNKIHFDLVQIL
jgi:hypothetical protein